MSYSFDFGFIKAGGAPIITISKLGLAFNKISRCKLGYPDKIEIGYDDKAHAIGVRAHSQGEESYYEFEKRAKNEWVRIGCRDFVKYLTATTGMDFTKAQQFIAEYDEEMKILVIIVDDKHIKK
jgi:hypothetical protein